MAFKFPSARTVRMAGRAMREIKRALERGRGGKQRVRKRRSGVPGHAGGAKHRKAGGRRRGGPPPGTKALAAFAKGVLRVDGITAFYREIEVIDLFPNTYSAVAFHGGYVGLTSARKRGVVFSIWDPKTDGRVSGRAELVEGSTRGNPKNKRFGHEGSGYHSELDYQWRPHRRYKIYVSVRHEAGDTLYSAFFAPVHERWELIARIRRPGIHYLTTPGGFVENPGGRNGHIHTRSTAFGRGWVYNGEWHPIPSIKFGCKDPDNANAFVSDGMLVVQIGGGVRAEQPRGTVFKLPRRDMTVPVMPE